MKSLKGQLETNKIAKIIELFSIFLVAFLIIIIFIKEGENNLIYNQIVLWITNIIMLIMVWIGLKVRGQGWKDFGLSLQRITPKGALKVFLLSLLVFVFALLGFMIGSTIMINITGIPQAADMSAYSFLKDNLLMLFLTLFGVYIVSSFGEEVIYRAFLINRISELGLDNKTNRFIAVLISAIVFGLAHYGWGIVGIVQTGFMGLALGITYIALKKRLWILILAHAYLDTILIVQIYLASN